MNILYYYTTIICCRCIFHVKYHNDYSYNSLLLFYCYVFIIKYHPLNMHYVIYINIYNYQDIIIKYANTVLLYYKINKCKY